MANPRANTLFHFTRQFDVLHAILRAGFWPRFCREEYEWLVRSRFSVRIPMVCFCDIPLLRIESHTAFYGTFGLGMTRDWGKRMRLNPVTYVREGSFLWEQFTRLFLIQGNLRPRNDDLSQAFANLLAMSKQFEGPAVDRGTGANITKEFYQECEWRYVLQTRKIGAFLTNDVANEDQDRTNQANDVSRAHPLTFRSTDIRYLLVESDQFIEPLADFLLNDGALPFSKAERVQLVTRIQVLASLQHDL